MFEKFSDIVTVEDIMDMLGVGRSTVYSMLRNNNIPHVRVGRKYIIPKSSVIGFLDATRYNGSG